MKTLKCIMVLGIAAELAACGGSGGSIAPRASVPTNAPGGTLAQTQASLRIAIPTAQTVATSGASKRSPQYVTSFVQSIAIAVDAGTCTSNCTPIATVTANLTSTSPGCAATAGATVCTIPLPLQPGSYLANIDLRDGPLDVAKNVTGAHISTAVNTPITVVAGSPNVNPVTLYGVPAGVVYTPIGNGGTFTAGALSVNAVGGTVQFRIDAVDNDGQIMIGPGAPAAVANATTQAGFTFAQDFPVTGVVTMTAPTLPDRNLAVVQVTLQGPQCAAGGLGVCTSTLNVANPSVWAVADSTNRTVDIYNAYGSTNNATTQIGGGFNYPYALTFDGSGNLFVSDDFTGAASVRMYAPPYTGAPVVTVTGAGVTDPVALTVASDGTLFVCNRATNNVAVYVPPYTQPPVIVTNGMNTPAAIAVNAQRFLFVVNAGGGLSRYLPPYTGAPTTTTFGANQGSAIAVDRNGSAYVTESGNGTVVVFNGLLAAQQVITLPVGAAPSAVAFTPTGDMAVAIPNLNAVAFYKSTAAYTAPWTPTVTKTNVVDGRYIAFDPLGELYVSDTSAGGVSLFRQPALATAPIKVTNPNVTSPRGIATFP